MSKPKNIAEVRRLAELFERGELSTDAFAKQVSDLEWNSTARLLDATVDLDRRRRCGYPEVVYGEGKTVEAIERIFHTLLEAGTDVFATRIDETKAARLECAFPEGRYNPIARTFRIPRQDAAVGSQGRITIVTAGTSDLPVAEEARETAEWMGADVQMVHDVGVAGPQRLPMHLEVLEQSHAVVVIAGMEGALPSVVGGYVSCPVIAVPTSVGYGASFQGVAALLGMLNSCASNVTVVNIDAGFKGAYVAGMIARQAAGVNVP